jgi:hypothetical protein
MAEIDESLLKTALTLPRDQRAELARNLLLSLEEPDASDPTEVERLWNLEIDRRIDAADESAELDCRIAVERVRAQIRNMNKRT